MSDEGADNGAAYSEVRSTLPLEKLEPYLIANIPGYTGPLTIKQFNASPPLPPPRI